MINSIISRPNPYEQMEAADGKDPDAPSKVDHVLAKIKKEKNHFIFTALCFSLVVLVITLQTLQVKNLIYFL